ncbi:acyl-CoA carboxylase subunit epsilon [Nonomuraea sp. LP-02]|uniref:acyl-CoA carboxylase subunit epsilon n=1 Tax=Nonomuraea sp. LP-02 TaxID=3097960 RepID=UPI002E305BD9|nr:acyl-CoA carboxylase subunit epsilon [Nonomuraea sp. LP-02]MED7924530.1 acyl-CoA carboxylase subunit epsilon [Nonomuraea sp. LP-02]
MNGTVNGPVNGSALTVVKGAPSPEELAALVVAVHATHAARPEPAARPVTHLRRVPRHPLARGPRGWRESSWNLGGRL